jgi:hypothetical protein
MAEKELLVKSRVFNSFLCNCSLTDVQAQLPRDDRGADIPSMLIKAHLDLLSIPGVEVFAAATRTLVCLCPCLSYRTRSES